MSDREIKMGTIGRQFNDGMAKNITFCVTEECNLRCKYCYMTGKNSFHRMSLDVAKKAVDYFLSQEPEQDAVIWEFIGGEPLLEIELIDQISDYIKEQMYLRDHPWFNNYIFNVGSNGVLYDDPRVQAYIRKNATHISMGITIDGTKRKHDMNRVFRDGSGSYDAIIENVKLWKKQFPYASTKVTFASDDLKYLKESIIHLWNLGLNIIPANVVFEDVWKEGDTDIFRQQLMELADYIIENELWYDHSVRFFDPNVGHPLSEGAKQQRFCGSGKMSAVDCSGKLYPCIRFLDFCMPGKPALCVGDIYDGVIPSRMKQFEALNIQRVNDEECNRCPVASGCFSCTGCNYEYSETNSIFNRTKFHCEIQKVQVECNEYFWTEVAKRMHAVTPFERNRMRAYQSGNWQIEGTQYLYFLLSDHSPSYCMYAAGEGGGEMSAQTLKEGLAYAHANHMIPVFLGDPYDRIDEVERYRTHVVMNRLSELSEPVSEVALQLPIIETPDEIEQMPAMEHLSVILPVRRDTLCGLAKNLELLAAKTRRINIIKQDLAAWSEADLSAYACELETYQKRAEAEGLAASVNVFDRKENKNMGQCQAGRSDFTLAPNGSFYACPAFYYSNPEQTLGTLETGLVVPEAVLYGLEKAVPCNKCQQTSCLRCVHINKAATGTVNLAAEIQCAAAGKEEALR